MELNDEPSAGEAQALVWNHILSYVHSMSLKCAMELGIPDIIHDHGSPITLPDLVSTLAIPKGRQESLRRLMRLLIYSGFFALQNSEEQEAYALTAASRFLLKGNSCIRPMASLLVHPNVVQPLDGLSGWFRNESFITPFEMQHGMTFWGYCSHDPSFNITTNEGMASDSRLLMSNIIDKCRKSFKQSTSLVDVGGGIGPLAKGIADAFPHLEVTVLDLPHVVYGLNGTKNLKFMAGDMFKSIPSANTIMLKWVLHDWGDNDCVKILKRCKEAITGNEKGEGKVIVVDIVMEKYKEAAGWSKHELFYDILMMSIVSGKERTEEEWAQLFLDAGFIRYSITPLVGSKCIIEVYP